MKSTHVHNKSIFYKLSFVCYPICFIVALMSKQYSALVFIGICFAYQLANLFLTNLLDEVLTLNTVILHEFKKLEEENEEYRKDFAERQERILNQQ